MRISIYPCCILLLLMLVIQNSDANAADKNYSIKVSSTSFTNGSTIPKRYTADGKDGSPALSWSSVPKGTKSIAITCEDPDAPMGTWFHWIIFNISPQSKGLIRDIKKTGKLAGGVTQGANDFRKIGYNGPSPPRGPAHHYHFKVFALNKKLDLKPGVRKGQFYKSIKGNVLAQGKLTGLYQRK